MHNALSAGRASVEKLLDIPAEVSSKQTVLTI